MKDSYFEKNQVFLFKQGLNMNPTMELEAEGGSTPTPTTMTKGHTNNNNRGQIIVRSYQTKLQSIL